jgi:uncharacterized repeat protein (TIGR01451 family)
MTLFRPWLEEIRSHKNQNSKSKFQHKIRRRPIRQRRSAFSLFLEPLEGRVLPSTTPFAIRFSTNDTGDITMIANTLETASTVNNPGRTQQDVIDAQNGVGANVNNNSWSMALVDADNDPTTFDSSTATLNLPLGSQVLFAGLYWGANSSSALRNQAEFATPTSGGYTLLNGAVIGDSTGVNPAPNPPGSNYEGFADVTSLVQAGGNGDYTVANVQADIGPNFYAGWSMVIVFRAPGMPPRNLIVFDGYQVIRNGDPPLDIPISGFLSPPFGPVNANVGVVAYEGDLGLTGDSMMLNGTTLSNGQNPADNFFNSTISNLGTPFTAKNPNYQDQLSFDADLVQVPAGVIANSATSATVTLTTTGDTYFPGVVTTAIDLFAPNLATTKTVTDLNGGSVTPGDTLQYTLTVTNMGPDPSSSSVLTDLIPSNTQYVPGSLQIVSGANAG